MPPRRANIRHARRRRMPASIAVPLVIIGVELAGLAVLLWMLAGAVVV